MNNDLDRILGELQQEVEELTADLERQDTDHNINNNHESRNSNNNTQTSPTGENSSESDSDLLSLEDIEEEVAKIGSSLKKQPSNIPSSSAKTSSRSSASSPHSLRGKLQRSVSPALTKLQTSFINSSRTIDSSNASSPKSANTISPLSPRGIDSLRDIISPDLGQSLENSSNSLLQKDIVNTVVTNNAAGIIGHNKSPSSLSGSLPRQITQLKSDDEIDDVDSSDNSDSETESDTDSDSDYNPLSMTSRRPLKMQRSMTDLAVKSHLSENLKRSASSGNRAKSGKSLEKHTPPSLSSPNSLNTQQSKIKRRPTTAQYLDTNQRDRDLNERIKSPDRAHSKSCEISLVDKENSRYNNHRDRESDENLLQRSKTRGRDTEIQGRSKSRTRERELEVDRERNREREKAREREKGRERTKEKSIERTFPNNTQETYDSSDNKNMLGRRLSRKASGKGREKYKTTEKELEDRERAKSRTRERAKSRTRELENNRERAKSRTRETETDFDKEKVSTLERANTRSRDTDDRGRSKRVPDNISNDRGRSKSRPRETEERGRSRSKPRETEERRGRSKSTNRERAISREREMDIDFEKERDLHLERLKVRGQDETEKSKQLDRAKSRRDKSKTGDVKNEKEEPKLPEVKITTRIYIDDSRQFKTLALTSKMNALNIIEYFRKRNAVEEGNEWTIFELVNEFGLERPLRDWEIVTTVIGSWEPKMSNALLLKKYAYRDSLTVEGLSNGVPPLFGWLHLETKKNKWQKRYFFLKDGSIYHCKDAKGVDPILLCTISNFDVYTLTRTMKKAPKPFVFALKSLDRVAMFENPEDYVHYLCADHKEKMKDWVLSIRNARNQMMLENNPELFSAITGEQTSPTSPKLSSKILHSLVTLPGDELDIGDKNTEKNSGFSSTEQWANVRRHVRPPAKGSTGKQLLDFTDNPSPPATTMITTTTTATSDEEKGDLGVFKSGSLLDYERHNPPLKTVETEVTSFAEGSLLATTEAFFENYKEKEKVNSNGGGTLVQINDDVKFHKGSLLEVKVNRDHGDRDHGESNGTLVHIDDDVRFHKGSLLESRGNRDHVDNVSSNNTLVNIDDELKFHKGSLLATRGTFSPANKDNFEMTLPHTPEYNKGSLLARGLLTPNGKDTFEISHSQTPEFNRGSLLARGLLSPSKDSFEGSSHSSNLRPRPERKFSNGPLISIGSPPTRNGPKITSPSTSPSPGKKLLQLDLSPDAKHTLNLRNKDFKPLLSFVPGEKPELPVETEAMRVQREARETGKTLLNLGTISDSNGSEKADEDINNDDENDF
ncbi:13243_t:CDS:2 [Ambispora gerdemannii]|uniref:13243_t:CDS:1 n=1 Tax=Ambispora gerdemannii TaxID=144530 RepID=A0A9N9ASW5_9GLOM|nr:13243_t:CDS:2 [Ambispora gerdemannii]